MRPVDRYVREVMRNVFASRPERERFEADLRAHFAEAEARGEPPARIIREMGPPEDVAGAFNAEREMRPAGFWLRLVAFAGDFGALVLLCLPLVGLVLVLQSHGPAPDGPAVARFLATIAVALAVGGIVIFYFPILEWRFGRTLGKQLMRIRAVREDGGPVGLGAAFVRRLSLFFELLVVDALFIPFTDRRQRALDVVARTLVVREPGESAPPWAYVLCLLLPVAACCALVGMVLLCAPG